MNKFLTTAFTLLLSPVAFAGQIRSITVTTTEPACYQFQSDALKVAISEAEQRAKNQCRQGYLAHRSLTVTFDGNCYGPVVTAVFNCELN